MMLKIGINRKLASYVGVAYLAYMGEPPLTLILIQGSQNYRQLHPVREIHFLINTPLSKKYTNILRA